ncbi:hypothetical protein EON81_02890 [bacterium]|nr:MAG: hypothetical protein EON81_02890 [bacterium]
MAPASLFVDIARFILNDENRPLDWYSQTPTGGEAPSFDNVKAGCTWALAQPKEADLALTMTGWLEARPGRIESLGYIREVPWPSPQRTVLLSTSGDCFASGGDSREAVRKQARLRGALRELCGRIRPTYAAITVDMEMETPDELRANPDSYAFRHFYLNPQAIPARIVSEIVALFPRDALRRTEEGVFIFSGDMWPDQGKKTAKGEGVGALLATL